MIYQADIEGKIGFDAVREMVSERCMWTLGAAKTSQMRFSTDYEEVRRLLGEVAEYRRLMQGENVMPTPALGDITERLKEIRPDGTYLSGEELQQLGATLRSIASIEGYVHSKRNEDGVSTIPYLDALCRGITGVPALVVVIDKTINRFGEVADGASAELTAIRRRIATMSGTIAAVMRRVLSRAAAEGIVDADTTATLRDGRLVVPVAPMNKRRLSGIVHDESASGKTVFIEPAEVVEVNNRLRELEAEEQREIIRILINVAAQIRPHIDELLESYDVLATLDFIRAKAVFAAEIGGSLPTIAAEPEMDWYHAVHPVLQRSLRSRGREVVPLNISLSEDKRILVISGPNAGGKSVTLKTVGVVQYMMQCGMLPPVYDNSRFGIFDNIFIDIGDDQSIEDDLSTYSSHLRNMRTLLEKGNSHTLMLIDEFGAGTEPQIGGAIAQALLAQFNNNGVWGVVTTHFQNLKKFASETAGLVNGSMLYDRQQMRPLFELAIGNPGSSFAIEIARKIGLPDNIIAEATAIVGSDYVNVDKYLLDIARDRRYWENKRQQIRQKEKKIEAALEKYEGEAESIRRKRSEILAEARAEAKKIFEGSNAAIEKAIRDIREAQAEREQTKEVRKAFEQEREKLVGARKATSRQRSAVSGQRSAESRQRPEVIAVGTNVTLKDGKAVGTVEAIHGDKAEVAMGFMRISVKLSELTATTRKAVSIQRSAVISAAATAEQREKQLNFKPEIDLRGMRVDEALQAVTYFIDDAVRFNIQRVRILHGTGTGALRQAIRQYLGTIVSVTDFHDEDVRFGGAGITVVEL